MIYREEVRDLFSVPEDYYLAHCISADFALGKGIAVEFDKRFDMKNQLCLKYPEYIDQHNDIRHCPYQADCILEGRVFNLVAKTKYYQKPTYESLSYALLRMRAVIISHNIRKVAMPTIGCGLDRLMWSKVSVIIKKIFDNTDIEILVCKMR